MNDEPRAYVTQDKNGNMVLVDPDVMQVASQHNIAITYQNNAERIQHFRNRVVERGDDPKKVSIVVACVDDPHGKALADILMPGTDWQAIRDRNEIPYARGLAGKQVLNEFLKFVDPNYTDTLMKTDKVAVVIVDHGTYSITI